VDDLSETNADTDTPEETSEDNPEVMWYPDRARLASEEKKSEEPPKPVSAEAIPPVQQWNRLTPTPPPKEAEPKEEVEEEEELSPYAEHVLREVRQRCDEFVEDITTICKNSSVTLAIALRTASEHLLRLSEKAK
jgi:hypothetical protein